MKGKKQTLLVLVLLLLVGVTSGYIANTYAKYASKVDKSGNATVAKWNFTKDNKDTTLTFNLAATANTSTLAENRIAPGTKGTFNIDLTNSSETGVDYTIKITEATNQPTNLKFYKQDPTGKTGAALTDITMTPGSSTIIDHLDAKTGSTAPAKTVKIYWVWEYDPNNETVGDEPNADTVNGLAAAGVDKDGNTVTIPEGTNPAEMTVNIEITGVQTRPMSTAGQPITTN